MTVSLELLGRGPSRPDLTRDLVLSREGLEAALERWSAPSPVSVPADATGLPDPAAVAAVLSGGAPVVIDLSGPLDEVRTARVVDLLGVAVHSGVGFGSGLVPLCTDAERVWSVLSATVAALTGGDVRAALAAPDPAALCALPRSAREAVRDVVTWVLVPGPRQEEVGTAIGAPDPGPAAG